MSANNTTTRTQEGVQIKKIRGAENTIRVEGLDKEILTITEAYAPETLELFDEQGNHIFGIYTDEKKSPALYDDALAFDIETLENNMLVVTVNTERDLNATIIRASKLINQIYAKAVEVVAEYKTLSAEIKEI